MLHILCTRRFFFVLVYIGMRLDLHVNELFSVKRELIVSANNIDSGQPAQPAQADLSRYFLLLVNFMDIKET